MGRDQVIATVKTLASDLMQQGINHVYLFGSVARGSALPESDVDLAFDLMPSAIEQFSLIDQSRIQRQLAAALGVRVDLVERGCLRTRIRDHAAIDMVLIF